MGNIQNDTSKAGVIDATHVRDRLSWVTKARSLAATTLERERADSQNSGFYLALPHQIEKPGP